MKAQSMKTQVAVLVFGTFMVKISANPHSPQADAKVASKVGLDLFMPLSVADHLNSTLCTVNY